MEAERARCPACIALDAMSSIRVTSHAEKDALARVAALASSWVGFDDSHHYGDAVLKAIGPDVLNRDEMANRCDRCGWVDGCDPHSVTCHLPPAKSLSEQARERGIKPVGTDVDIETGKRTAPEDTRPLPPGRP